MRPLASMRPRRVRLGCRCEDVQLDSGWPASMRPRRVRLGCSQRAQASSSGKSRCFNEAEARAPRMLQPYKPLDTHAILPCFRPAALGNEQSVPDCARDHLDDVKEPTIPTL